MYIESIQLKNFRNYESLQLNLDKGTNIFFGDAQGKTNILEAAYLCEPQNPIREQRERSHKVWRRE